ncbi:MAG: histidine kinase [Bacteroidota bacterium]|nr:histidine kinase [Bacteroidota bacterium]
MNDSNCKNSRWSYHLIILAGILGLALLITLVFFRNYEDFGEFMLSYAWAVVICATQWLGNSYIYGLLDKKYSWQDHLVKRAIYGSLALIAYSATAYLAVQMIMYKLVTGSLPDNPVSWGLRSSYVAILISFIISLIFVAVAFFQYWKKSLVDAEKFKAEMLMYKYEALQNQINPHFLFNSFNVLSDLVYEDQEKATDFIRQLSQLFRYVLDSRDKELVPIKEELEFVEAYSYLLQTRFEDKLSIVLDFEAREHEMIVPMTLQLLIENCVKHNEISALQPLSVQILRREEYLKVENNLQAKPEEIDSRKTGLSNIRQQFRYFTDKEIIISQTEHSFAVEVPVLKLETG